MKSLLLECLKGNKVERPPVWLMRQAGRYMKEYRDLKEKHSFLELCNSSELATIVSLQPIKKFDPDCIIVFADILSLAPCMGFEIDFNPGPIVKNPIKYSSDLKRITLKDGLKSVEPTLLTLRNLKDEIFKLQNISLGRPKTLLGFSAAPYTLLCYLLDQENYKNFQRTQIFLKTEKTTVRELLDIFSEIITEYCLAQFESGADAIQLFDTWADNLTNEEYKEFALPYTEKIIQSLKRKDIPVILYTSGSKRFFKLNQSTKPDCISIDWKFQIDEAFSNLDNTIALQGNINPTDMFLNKEKVIDITRKCCEASPFKSKHIINLGHGVLIKTPEENVRELINTVKNFRY